MHRRPSSPQSPRPRRSGLTVSELVVVLLVLAILSLIAVLLFGRARENTVRQVCRSSADSMMVNARAIAAEDGAVTAVHLETAFAESRYPSGSSWDPAALRVLHRTPDGDCRIQFTLADGDVVAGEPELVGVEFTDPGDGPTPVAPVDLIAVPGDRSVTITWSPGDPDDDSVTGYQVETCVVGGTCSVSVGGIGSVVVTDLENGSSYRFRVAASNDTGVGEYSESTDVVVPRTVPGTPSAPTVDVDGTSAEVSVPPGSDNGAPIIDHTVICSSPDGGATVTTTGASPVTVTGLTPPPDALTVITYTCTVRSRNEAGESPESPPSDPFETVGVPTSPLNLAVELEGDASVDLSWSAPSFDGGSPVTGYLLEQDDGTVWVAVANLGSTVTSFTVSGLENGTSYRFRVTAENAVGWGAVSDDVTATPYGLPAAPTGMLLAADDAEVSLSWTAADGNGRPVLDYAIEYGTSSSGPWTTVDDGVSTSTSYVVTGLTNGTEYTFRVRAETLAGLSEPVSGVARPLAAPSAPTSLLASPGTGADYEKITLSWSAPSSDGGSAVTSYTVELATNPDFSSATSFTGASSPRSLTGLTANTTYHLRVRAITAYGAGPWSSTSALTVPSAPTVSITCPQGYTSAGAQVNALTSTCTVLTSTTSGATIDGLVAGPGGYSTTFTTASYSAPDVPLANLYDSQMMANARLCNASGCGPYAAYLGVSASSVPQPGTPIVTKGDCAFGYCFVYFSATHAWTYEVNLYGGPSTGVLRCYNVACADGAGAWPVGFDGTNYYTERANPGSGTRTLHVTDTCGGLGGCARSMLVPQGTWIRVAGTNGFASGAPSGWPNSGWCVPNGGEPLAASCNWSTGPGVAEYRGGYVLIG